jgi:hypothetical protein
MMQMIRDMVEILSLNARRDGAIIRAITAAGGAELRGYRTVIPVFLQVGGPGGAVAVKAGMAPVVHFDDLFRFNALDGKAVADEEGAGAQFGAGLVPHGGHGDGRQEGIDQIVVVPGNGEEISPRHGNGGLPAGQQDRQGIGGRGRFDALEAAIGAHLRQGAQ